MVTHHFHSREAGYQRVRARGRGCLPHLFPPMRADWTASGACTRWLDRAPEGRNVTGIWWRH